jgi:glycosyltransferase involved in cell wall biosynthesis
LAGSCPAFARGTALSHGYDCRVGRISVVVVAYDRPAYLQEALDCIARQTLPPSEVIVVDDASPEPLEGQVRTGDVPVRFVRLSTNSGPAVAAATGIESTKGDFVALLNDDDLWADRFLEMLSGALHAAPSAGVAFADHGVVHADGTVDDEEAHRLSHAYGRTELDAGEFASAEDFARAALIQQAVPAQSFSMYRREALRPRTIRAGGDIWDYFVALGVTLGGWSGVYVPDRLGWYRVDPHGITSTWGHPKPRVRAASRRLAADRLAMRSPHLRSIRKELRRRHIRWLVHGLSAVSRDPRLLAFWVRETLRALLRPGSPVPRGRK